MPLSPKIPKLGVFWSVLSMNRNEKDPGRMEATYNTSDITPMEPWTEQGWNALYWLLVVADP